jgi:hypothetical protein
MKMPVGTKVQMQVGRFVVDWYYKNDNINRRKEWDWIIPSGMYGTDEMDSLETAIAFCTVNDRSVAAGDFPFRVEAAVHLVESNKERTNDYYAYY